VLMEAAASGVASIATDSGAPREIVEDGVTGLLVPPAAPEALANAITKLYRSPELLAAMGSAARARSASFTWDRSIDTLERVLQEAARAGGRSRE
jgi:glycosyltransferase involved in cell wall biosynthesis